MATISVQMGPLTASRTMADAKAQARIERYLRAYGLWSDEDTNQVRLNRYLAHLVQHTDEAAEGEAIRDALDARRGEIMAELKAERWGD